MAAMAIEAGPVLLAKQQGIRPGCDLFEVSLLVT
jgi:hypothetical protein